MCELQLTVGIMSCTALLTTLCGKGGTHPFSSPPLRFVLYTPPKPGECFKEASKDKHF
jgi:hypothetical protein